MWLPFNVRLLLGKTRDTILPSYDTSEYLGQDQGEKTRNSNDSSWQELFDPMTGECYYFNPHTNESKWPLPSPAYENDLNYHNPSYKSSQVRKYFDIITDI